MSTVHLRVVELKRDGQSGLEPRLAVTSPDYKRIVEDSAIHPDCTVYIVLSQCRSPDYDAVGDVVILTGLGNLSCQTKIIVIELIEVFAVWNITRADLPLRIGDYCIDCYRIVSINSTTGWSSNI